MPQLNPYLIPFERGAHHVAELAIKGPRPWVDVTAHPYRADPTGASDATAAMQAALDAAGAVGGVCMVPPGVYTVGKLFLTGDRVALLGQGNPLIRSAAAGESGSTAGQVLKVTATDTILSGFRLEYTGPQTAGLNRKGIRYEDGAGTHLLSEVEVFGCPHEGISVGDGQFRAVNCHAHDNGYAGLDIGSTYLPAQVIGGSYHDNGETFGTGDGYGVTAHSGRILMVGVQAYGNYTVQLDVHGSNTVAALFEGCQVWCNGTEHQNPTTFASSAWGISVTVSAREVLIKGCQFHGIRTRNQAGAINVTADISSLDGNYNVAIEGNTFADFQPKTALILCRPFDTKTLRVSGNQCRNCSGSGLPYFLFIEPLATETPLHRRKIPRLVEITGNVIDGGSRIEVKAGSLISIHDNLAADVETHTEDGGGLQRDLITVSTDNTAVGRVQTYNNREISYRRNNVQQFASAPTVWTWKRGDRAQNSLGAAVGDTVGWYCTTSGTFKTGTVSATTTAGGRTITVPAGDIRKFVPGQFLAVVGVTWGTALADRVELLAVDETTNELTVAYNASATVTANLSWPAPTFAKFEVLS